MFFGTLKSNSAEGSAPETVIPKQHKYDYKTVVTPQERINLGIGEEVNCAVCGKLISFGFNQAKKLTPYGRTEYDKAFLEDLSDDEIEKARKFAVRCWMGFGCSNRYKNGFRSSQQSNSPNTTRAWDSFPEILRFAAERLKQVQIENLDALELICRYDTEDVFIYADPPYLHSTRKNYLYRHEMSDVQHLELLDRLQNHPGKVLLSGYDNELYNSALKSWNKVQKHTQAEGGLKRIETLWMNY